MYKIIIKNLEIFAYHGCCEEEKVLGQVFCIDCDVLVNIGNTDNEIKDDVKNTLCYAEVADFIVKNFQKDKFNLIETAAEMLCNLIISNFSKVDFAKIVVKKPNAPIDKKFEYVAVEYEKAR
ncbi:MAG: dihydroneopterin aldolase [Candidatus Improbicoccus pseudotrichonymphae]|uniref:7,8-dihydroneopterin aldolase n=1 Tax=Candidatus Improbicoccus pseudotrichonymphae TaxID=3033792 RepID=A0AA48KWS3_9FIRM|nr:MAG: dihydroneopterin aldolase [Candidatus Improbicoccus pseudotrichonymphae]